MARIRQVYPSFVELDEQAHEQWTSEPATMLNCQRELAKPLLWLLVRGESNREGSRMEHSTTGSSDTFQKNMFAYLHRMVEPLEANGFEVVVCGDLRCAAGADEDVKKRFNNVFGRRVHYVRVQPELLGDLQLASITSAWDVFRYQ